MAISPYIRSLRERVGHELLLLPSVSVLCRDDRGRVLLVRDAGTGSWSTIGGLVEPDEHPRDAAVREAKEEAGVDVELDGVLDVLGGPAFRVRYPNGDEAAYVTIVFAGRIVGGTVEPDGEETIEAGWFDVPIGPAVDLHPFTRASLAALGLLAPGAEPPAT